MLRNQDQSPEGSRTQLAMRPEVVIQTPCPADLTCVCSDQVIVDGELTIPCQKPDMERVIDFRVSCEVTNFQVITTPLGPKVIVQGFVHIGVQYVAKLPEQPVHFAHFDIPFHDFFLCAENFCNVTCCVEFADFRQLDCRRLSKVVMIFLCATPLPCPPSPPGGGCNCPEPSPCDP